MRRSLSIGIKSKKLVRGMYLIHYKHLDVIIMNSDGRHWEAFLPTGCFAQSDTKSLTIILACSEIDLTPRDIELEEEQKDANWYKKYFPDFFFLKISSELRHLVIGWFQDITEQCDGLTSGNISHKRATIKGIASRSKQYIEEFGKDCELELRSKLVKYFSAIEDMADELTTGNVARKEAVIKGFACRARNYLIEHT